VVVLIETFTALVRRRFSIQSGANPFENPSLNRKNSEDDGAFRAS
jgi:hypothetical protein